MADPVDVNEIEIFAKQLDQITPYKCKGVVVASGIFTSTAMNFARRKGIALVRLLPDEQVEYLMYFQSPEQRPDSFQHSSRLDEAFTDERYVGENRNFFAVDGERHFTSWSALYRDLLSG